MERNPTSDNSGQSIIEFMVSFIFVLGFVFLLLRMALIYSSGYLVHYATFMSSRMYLSYDVIPTNTVTDEGAGAKAKEVFESFRLGKFIPSVSDPEFRDPTYFTEHNRLYTGPYVDFQQNFVIPGLVGSKKVLNLRSESFLGREPSRVECIKRVCAAMKSVGDDGLGDCKQYATVADNGC